MMFLFNTTSKAVQDQLLKHSHYSPKRDVSRTEKYQHLPNEEETILRISHLRRSRRAISTIVHKALANTTGAQKLEKSLLSATNEGRSCRKNVPVTQHVIHQPKVIKLEKFIPCYDSHHYRTHQPNKSCGGSVGNQSQSFSRYNSNVRTLKNAAISYLTAAKGKSKMQHYSIVRSHAYGKKPSKNPKLNQDEIITALNLGSEGDVHFFGVADGHGLSGKHVSLIVKDSAISKRIFPFSHFVHSRYHTKRMLEHLEDYIDQYTNLEDAIKGTYRAIMKDLNKSQVDILTRYR